MNNELYEQLKQYEQYLYTAYYSNYVRSMPTSSANELQQIYHKLGNQRTINLNCNKCVYDLCKELGNLYFNYKPEVIVEQVEPQEPQTKDAPEQSKNTKPNKTITNKKKVHQNTQKH